MKTKSQLPTKVGAVAVSLVMQRSFVALILFGFGLTIVNWFQVYIFTDVRFSASFALSMVLSTLLPAVFFGVAYYFGPKYPVVINRWFIATLKAIMAVALAGIIQLLLNLFQDVGVPYVQSFHNSAAGVVLINCGASLIVLTAIILFYLRMKAVK